MSEGYTDVTDNNVKEPAIRMKDCEKLEMCTTEIRKAYIEKQNRLIQKKQNTPEPSVLGSSILSHDISLNSLSLKTESEDAKENTLQNYSSRSKKPSEVYYECMTTKLSEKDHKILKLMAIRREMKMKESDLALLARNVWEEERLQQAKKAEKKKTSLMEYLARKKQLEELATDVRKNSRNENLKQEKILLEMKISEKQEKVERRQKEICFQKKTRPEILTTKYQLLLHHELKKQKEEEEELERALHKQEYEAKERRSQEKLKCIKTERYRKLREESLKQNLRWQAAKNVRDEMNKTREEERIRHLRYSERNQLLKKERVNWTKEWRRKIILEKNERAKQQHAIVYNKMKEEEKEKMNRTRRLIQAKDFKMKIFKEKREEAILKSRINARMTAGLREKMRQTYDL